MKTKSTAALLCLNLITPTALAQDDAELAKKLANPVASLISVPVQANYDENIGPSDSGSVWRTNLQPVVPFSLNDEWNLISRTIFPVIDQSDVPIRGAGESGIGDVLQSVFFSPKAPTAGGWIWGAGPVLLLDTASEDALGAGQWGIGPTGVVLKQQGSWTVGGLANHVESISDDDLRPNISATFLQPFVSYITPTKTTLAANIESTYDWESEQWSVPINLVAQQLLKMGSQILQVGVGARYWADSPDNGPQDWGFRFQITFLYPK